MHGVAVAVQQPALVQPVPAAGDRQVAAGLQRPGHVVGVGDVQQRAALQVGRGDPEQLGEGGDPVQGRLEPRLRPPGEQSPLGLGVGAHGRGGGGV